jgi:serine/threonine protein kinase
MFCPRCITTRKEATNSCQICGHGGAPLLQSDPWLGRLIGGQYKLLRCLGEGGVGIVYLAEQRAAKRFVAIKLLPAVRAQSLILAGRFRREGVLLAKLLHPSVVKLHNLGQTEEGDLWMALEHLHGENLAERLVRRPILQKQELLSWFRPLCEALFEAHNRQIVHRDIKPENLFLSRLHEGKILPKLLDFGLAAARSEAALTSAGSWGGSAPYMSPEHWRDLSCVESRSDQYSLAVVLFQCVAGRLPFEAKHRLAWCAKHLYDPAPSASEHNAQLPAALDLVLQTAMAKEPRQRYANLAEFWQSFEDAFSFAPKHYESPKRAELSPEATVLCNTTKAPRPTRPVAEASFTTRLYRRDPERLRLVSATTEKVVSATQTGLSTSACWLRSISGQSHQYLFAVGSHGVLLRSKDGGLFQVIKLSLRSHLNSVWSYDRYVCAVGANGALLCSSDSGETFSLYASEDQRWLWSCWGSREGNRFAVGEDGAFCSSRDAGARWRTTTLAGGASLYAIWGELHGASCALYIAGKHGLFLRSMNGGITWEESQTNTQQDLLSIWGDRKGELFVVGRDGVMLCSKDRGQSFESIAHRHRTTLYGAFGIGKSRFAIGDGGLLLHSTDGKEWCNERIGSSALYGLCVAQSSLLVVGNNGTLLRFALPEAKTPKLHERPLVQAWS